MSDPNRIVWNGGRFTNIIGVMRDDGCTNNVPQGGGSSFVYTQSTPSPVWTVPHNLNKRPSVTTVDHLGAQIFGDLVYIDDNIVQVVHGSPITGTVYCN